MTEQSNDLTITMSRGDAGVAIFSGSDVVLLRDADASMSWEFTNPVAAEIMCARLRAWANFIEWRAASEGRGR